MPERPEEAQSSEPSERELERDVEARREGAPGHDMAEEEAYEAEQAGGEEPGEDS